MQAQQNATYSDRIQIREQKSLPAIPSREFGRGYVSARTIQPSILSEKTHSHEHIVSQANRQSTKDYPIVVPVTALCGKRFALPGLGGLREHFRNFQRYIFRSIRLTDKEGAGRQVFSARPNLARGDDNFYRRPSSANVMSKF